MSIVFDVKSNTYLLHTLHSTYQIQIDSYNHLLHLWYGKRNPFPMDYLLDRADHGFSPQPGYIDENETLSLDILPQEYPSQGTGDFRSAALAVKDDKGAYGVQLFFKEAKIYNKPLPFQFPHLHKEGMQTLEIILEDPKLKLEAKLFYGVFEKEDVITKNILLENKSDREIIIERALSSNVDFISGDFDKIIFEGRHMMERILQRSKIEHGIFSISSIRGTSSHHYNPSLILAKPETTEDAGDCYGFALNYSGNFLIEVEKDQLNQIRVLMGINDEMFSYPLFPKQKLELPEAILSYSDQGLAELSHHFHQLFSFYGQSRNYKTRPVLLNSWEAFYMDFDRESFLELAKEAKELGMDGILLDDGWFGKRDTDRTSLGDWIENTEKLGGTLAELSKEVHDMGLLFGIWVEPEMISKESELYIAHPEWAIEIEGRAPVLGRHQLVLDLSNKEVVNYLDKAISRVIREGKVDVLKWDMNRHLTDIKDGKLFYDYVKGLYNLLNRIRLRFPNLLIEGCSGGGGRFDFGMLYYSPQIWTSDNTDAINRINIQYGTSFIYPPSTMSAHVTASPNHQTNRTVPLDTRGAVAMQGIFGYELDLRNLSREEKEKIKSQIKAYKQIEPLILKGDFYRLSNPLEEDIAAWSFVSKDKKKAFITLIPLEAEANSAQIYLKAKGLKDYGSYKEKNSGKVYSGLALMQAGIPIYPIHQYEPVTFIFEDISQPASLSRKSRTGPYLDR